MVPNWSANTSLQDCFVYAENMPLICFSQSIMEMIRKVVMQQHEVCLIGNN